MIWISIKQYSACSSERLVAVFVATLPNCGIDSRDGGLLCKALGVMRSFLMTTIQSLNKTMNASMRINHRSTTEETRNDKTWLRFNSPSAITSPRM